MARAQGVEPRLSDPESDVLPLDDARLLSYFYINLIQNLCQDKLEKQYKVSFIRLTYYHLK